MNRFFKTTDKKIDKLSNFKIPKVWWSRIYEYAFAIEFIKKDDVILDVGCGVQHPFKDYAKRNCKKVVGLDIDPMINAIQPSGTLEFVCADILDYKTDLKFDKIFLISTLEQSQDYMVEKFANMNKLLKDDGLIIITSDYPSLDPEKIIKYSSEAGFEVDGEIDFETNENRIYHATYKLYCYSLVLKKKVIKKVAEVKEVKKEVKKEIKKAKVKENPKKKG